MAAEWRADRHVDVDDWRVGLAEDGLRMHAAEVFLASFGGLKIDVRGSGVSCAREPFEPGPLLAAGEGDRFIDWGAVTGKSLFPVGEFGDGRLFLAISGISPDDVAPA
ncbi:SUKH-3 domain-containing protein [Amycolatopsis sp. NPDC021455]|uniref:SUKH-3 domain-containing protein n=1 Tax=Amycolatopsis sp. NPDC021455 TaxID=3154901 RepID=UPI00340B4E86